MASKYLEVDVIVVRERDLQGVQKESISPEDSPNDSKQG